MGLLSFITCFSQFTYSHIQDGTFSSALIDKARALKYQYGGLVFCHSYFNTMLSSAILT
jgi:hypothetical protein